MIPRLGKITDADRDARSFSRRFSEADETEVQSILNEIAAQTRAELAAGGIADADITSLFEIDVRYEG